MFNHLFADMVRLIKVWHSTAIVNDVTWGYEVFGLSNILTQVTQPSRLSLSLCPGSPTLPTVPLSLFTTSFCCLNDLFDGSWLTGPNDSQDVVGLAQRLVSEPSASHLTHTTFSTRYCATPLLAFFLSMVSLICSCQGMVSSMRTRMLGGPWDK